MSEKQTWPGVYRSKVTGDVALFTARSDGYILLSPSGKRCGQPISEIEECNDTQKWERVTLRAEPATDVKPDAPKWPAAYRSRGGRGSIVLFTGRREGFYIVNRYCADAIGALNASWVPCDGANWDRVDLYVDEAPAAQPAPEEPAPMNLFQALAWLADHPGQELLIDGGPLRVKMASSQLLYFCESSKLWHTWYPDYARHRNYSATIPKRQLPTPPAGYEWRETELGLRLDKIGAPHICYHALDTDEDLADAEELLDIRACLIAEYETRPR